jgi:hypothetical protein
MNKMDIITLWSDFWEGDPKSSAYRGNFYGDYPAPLPSVVYVDNVKVTIPPDAQETMCSDLVALADLEKEALSALKAFLSYSPDSSTSELLKYKNGLLEKVDNYRRSSEVFKAKYTPKLPG